MMCKRPPLSDDPRLSKKLYFFADRISYSIIKINGQRILGPPKNWKESEPPKGSEVFVARIPNSFCEIDLYNLLKPVGIIYKIRWMINFSTYNRGFAFVKFANPECAREAIEKFNNYHNFERTQEGLRVFRLGVVLSMDKTDLILSFIPVLTPLTFLLDLIKPESANVITIKELERSNNFKKVLVKFDENRSAALARRCFIAARSKVSPSFSVEWFRDPKLILKDPSKFVDSSSSSTSTKKAPSKTRRNHKPIPQSSPQNIRTDNKTHQITPQTYPSNLIKPLINPSFASALAQHDSQLNLSPDFFSRIVNKIITKDFE